MPNMFPNTFYNSEQEKNEIVEKINSEANHLKLYSEFIDFYNNYCINNRIIFVTGRQESCFKRITELVLKDINYDKIIYFPNNAIHTKEYYLNWKLETIKDIIYSESYNTNIYIYDDVVSYYDKLMDLTSNYKIECREIKEANDWTKIKQAICQWCTEPIFEASVYDVKCFWNRGFSGYPICDKCLGNFKCGKQTTNNEDRIRLGLKPEIIIQNKIGLDKWI